MSAGAFTAALLALGAVSERIQAIACAPI